MSMSAPFLQFFIDARVRFCDDCGPVAVADLYDEYERWVGALGLVPKRPFVRAVRELVKGRGVTYGLHRVDGKPARAFVGMALDGPDFDLTAWIPTYVSLGEADHILGGPKSTTYARAASGALGEIVKVTPRQSFAPCAGIDKFLGRDGFTDRCRVAVGILDASAERHPDNDAIRLGVEFARQRLREAVKMRHSRAVDPVRAALAYARDLADMDPGARTAVTILEEIA